MSDNQDGGMTDRYGIPVSELTPRSDDAAFIPLLHNHLLDGMSDEAVLARLVQLGQSKFQANLILKQSKKFVADMGIDLEARRAGRTTPVELAIRLATSRIHDARIVRDREASSPFVYRGYIVDGDERTKEVLKRYIVSKVVPEFWIAKNNQTITPWTMEDQERLLECLVARDSALIAAFQNWRDDLNKEAEAGNLAAVRQAEFVPPPAPVSE